MQTRFASTDRRTEGLLLVCLLLVWPARAVFADECGGATLAATAEVGVTRLTDRNPRLFVSANFHGPDRAGIAEPRDLAYVSTVTEEGSDRHVLSVLLSLGNGCFKLPDKRAPLVVVGRSPRLMVPGDFNNDTLTDLAIVDGHVDQFTTRPTLRIVVGTAPGVFAKPPGVDVVPLGDGESPVAIAVGHFRDAKKLDVAIVSTSTAGGTRPRGVLRLLFNNGSGEFTEGPPPPIPLGDFVPSAIVASNRFRPSGDKVDLVIKEAVGPGALGQRRILYLQNAGNGTFPSIAPFTGAGGAPVLLLGSANKHDTAGDLADVITFDNDMTLTIFVNDGLGGFNRSAPFKNSATSATGLEFAGPPRFHTIWTDDQPLRLVAAVRRPGSQSVERVLSFTLTSNVPDQLEAPAHFRLERIGDPAANTGQTEPMPEQIGALEIIPPRTRSIDVGDAVMSAFLNPDRSVGGAGLLLSARQIDVDVTRGACFPSKDAGSKPRPTKGGGGGPKPPGVSCTPQTAQIECVDGPFCADRPVGNRCTCVCEPSEPPPPESGCRRTTTFPPILITVDPFSK
jgi:hypothetical protein